MPWYNITVYCRYVLSVWVYKKKWNRKLKIESEIDQSILHRRPRGTPIESYFFEKQLKLVGLVLALLVLTGLLRQASGYMIIVSLFLSQTLIEMSRNKAESLLASRNSSIDTILGWCFLFRFIVSIKQFAFRLIWLLAFTKFGWKNIKKWNKVSSELRIQDLLWYTYIKVKEWGISPLLNPTIVVVRLDEISPLGTNLIFSFLLVMNRDLP